MKPDTIDFLRQTAFISIKKGQKDLFGYYYFFSLKCPYSSGSQDYSLHKLRMKIFISSLSIPIGYQTPRFPSLHLPNIKHNEFLRSYLYYSTDIWHFTVLWCIIWWGIVYCVAGSLALVSMNRSRKAHGQSITSRRNISNCICILVTYLGMGGAQGFIVGAVVGVVLLAIYKAGSLSMSTWIPFCWGVALILYDIAASYLTSLRVL